MSGGRQRHRPWLAWVAAIAVAALSYPLVLSTRWPEWVMRQLGMPTDQLNLHGGVGLMLDVTEPLDAEAQRELLRGVRMRLAGPDRFVETRLRREATVLEVEVVGAPATEAEALNVAAALSATATLEFRMVAAGTELAAALAADARADAGGRVRAQQDVWQVERQSTDQFVEADSRVALEAWLGAVQAHDRARDAGLMLAIEEVEPFEPGQPVRWRTYLLEREVIIGAGDVADAVVQHNQYDGRPEVLLTFTEAAGRRFGETTERHVGDKLAIVVDGDVASAPVINSAIHGGRASIAMGAGPPDKLLAEATTLAAALKSGPLPGRLSLRHVLAWPANPKLRKRRFAAGVPFALAAGFLVLGAARLGRRVPWAGGEQATDSPPGAWPWARIAVTLAAVPVLVLLPRVPLPGVNMVELRNAYAGGPPPLGAFMLGLTPVITAAILVELAALAVPRWRRLRHGGPEARARLWLASLLLALPLAALQGFAMVRWLESMSALGVELVQDPGSLGFRVAAITTMVGATFVLVVLARPLSRHGSAGGFSTLLAAGAAIELVLRWQRLRQIEQPPPLATAYLLLVAAVVAGLTWLVLSRRVRAHADGPSVRLPTAGLVPFADVQALAALAELAFTAGLAVPARLLIWLGRGPFSHQPLRLALVAGSALLWSWLWSRPRPVAGLVAELRGRGADPDSLRRIFRVAVAVSLAWLALLLLLEPLLTRLWFGPFDVIALVVVTAFAHDLVAEARARARLGGPLVAVWPLHRVQDADAAVAALAAEGIPAHARGAGHRALLHFFAPYLPIELLVRAPDAARAQALLAAGKV